MLPATKYPNTSRTVSGTYSVDDQDVILRCDTSSAAVNITLQTIPEDHWNTLYKLYVIDDSNNAFVNNITITAPAGHKINGENSVVLNVNNSSCIIRISANNQYVCEISKVSNTNGGLPYKSYVAKVTALLGPANPNVIEIYNNTGRTYTWTTESEGFYRATPNIAFPDFSKMAVFTQVFANAVEIGSCLMENSSNENKIDITYSTFDGRPQSGLNIYFELRIYN